MLVFVESGRVLSLLRRASDVRCVITTAELAPDLDEVSGLAVSSSDPRRTFFELHSRQALHTQFYWADFPTEIDETADVHPTAFVAARNVRIGPRTVVQPRATILERCTLGASVGWYTPARCCGESGFRAPGSPTGSSTWSTRVEWWCTTGCRCCPRPRWPRGCFGRSRPSGWAVRIGNQAFVSHNVQVGDRSFVWHGAVISGYVRIGSDSWIGPGAVVSNEIRIGPGAQVSLGATVVGDVSAG
jgi:UDP-3-O-[3-hydroxymyristoyl] glucosamine N-acyltransferase